MTFLYRAAASLAVLSFVGIAAPDTALAAPSTPSPVTTSVPAATPATGPDASAEASQAHRKAQAAASAGRPIDVVVLLKDQPSRPGAALERSNLERQRHLIATWAKRYNLTVHRQFGYLVNGFSARIGSRNAQRLLHEPEVASVKKERLYAPTEHTARELEGVERAMRAQGVDGTGMVVSIVDTGIDTAHRDMRLDDCAKAKITTVDTAHPGFTCKVPRGYNYADENYTIKDLTASQHGMHVAGIVAANGSESDAPAWQDHRIDGVAPNAQLLAMKVFSNAPGALASDADIIAAIEDSVKLGADIINMSLGSANGQRDASDGMARAVRAARDAGVISVIAAGNEGLNFSPDGTTDDAFGILDDGTLGAPGSQADTFTVASIDNGVVTQREGVYADGTEHSFPYALATGKPDGVMRPVVAAGLGRPEDFAAGVDYRGKFVLIERGEIAFSEKFTNAIAKGAAGVLVYNSAAGGEAFPGMGGIDDFTILSASLRRSDGLAIAEALKKGPVTLRLSPQAMLVASDTKLQPSSFTSWGTTPTLDFEPEIAGIGGNVYSTLNDNSYGSMSGTSMATPNIAGMLALVLESLHKSDPSLGRAAALKAAEVALMNTALIPAHDGVGYAPRQVGAGLAQVDKAVATDVLATVDGEGAAALREVHGDREITVTLTNRGNEDREFVVPADQQVLRESNNVGAATVTSASAETLTANVGSVRVGAHSTATVTFRLSPDTSVPGFIEGWARLESSADDQPSLAVPYLGFVGDWNREPIIKAPGEPWSAKDPTATSLVSMDDETLLAPLNGEGAEHWMSPNDDSAFDTVMPSLNLLRNAYEIDYTILNADGSELTTVAKEHDVSRSTLAELELAGIPPGYTGFGSEWDGRVYNPASGHTEIAEDGRYIYRVRARLGPDSPWQTVTMPFGVDRTPPELTITSVEGTTVTFTVTDEASGIAEGPSAQTPDGRAVTVTKNADGSYTAQAPADADALTITVRDRGYNLAEKTRVFHPNGLAVLGRAELEGKVQGISDADDESDHIAIRGAVGSDVASVEINGEKARVKDGLFYGSAALSAGVNHIVIIGRDADGREVARTTLTITYDNQAPVLSFEGLEADGTLPLTDGVAHLRGHVRDERAKGSELRVSVNGKEVSVGAAGEFSATVKPEDGQPFVLVTASDGANDTAEVVFFTGTISDADREIADKMPTFDNLACMFGACHTPTVGDGSDPEHFILRGSIQPGTTFTLTPGSRAGENGEMIDYAPIAPEVNADGTFTMTLPMTSGQNHFRFQLWNDSGELLADEALVILFDKTLPNLRVSTPILFGGTLFTNTPDVRFAGTAYDDGHGYTLKINGSTIRQLAYSGTGPQSNERHFDEQIRVANGDTMLVQLIDDQSNSLSTRIPVVLDQDKPTVEIAGAKPHEELREHRTIEGRAADPNLASVHLYVDGREVAQRHTTITGGPVSVESTLVKDKVPTGGSEPDQGSGDATGSRHAGVRGPIAADEAAGADSAEDSLDMFAQPEPAEGPVDPAHPSPTELSVSLDSATLAPGTHTIVVEGRDLAGNRTVEALTVTVASPDAGTDPDAQVAALTVEVDREDLSNKEKLHEAVVAALERAGLTGVRLELAEGARLREGANPLTVIHTDASGAEVRTPYVITLKVRERTITDQGVSVTGPIRGDDNVVITVVGDNPRTVTLTHDGAFAPIEAVVSIEAPEGSRVLKVLPDGRRIAVAATWANGRLTWRGEVPGTYLVVAPGAERPHVTHVSLPVHAPIASQTATGGAAASAPSAGADLARTGARTTPALLGASVMLAAGAALVAGRRRVRR